MLLEIELPSFQTLFSNSKVRLHCEMRSSSNY